MKSLYIIINKWKKCNVACQWEILSIVPAISQCSVIVGHRYDIIQDSIIILSQVLHTITTALDTNDIVIHALQSLEWLHMLSSCTGEMHTMCG